VPDDSDDREIIDANSGLEGIILARRPGATS
jgi:hypothetical protein